MAVVHRLLRDVFSLLLLRGTDVAVAAAAVVVALPVHRMVVVTIIIL